MCDTVVLFQAKFHIYEVIRVTERAVESRVNSFPSRLCLLGATELGWVNVLLSTEAQSKGKLLDPQQSQEPVKLQEAGRFASAGELLYSAK